MTRDEIKNIILERVNYLGSKKSTDYVAGIVVGMVQAFKVAGLLEETDDMVFEICCDL